MNQQAEIFNEIVESRRSVRKFDTEHTFDHETVKRSLERAILSANSSNMQLWEFYRILTPEAKKELAEICLNQNAARTASEIVVFVARPDLWQDRQQKLLAHFQTIMPDRNDKKAALSYKYYEEWIPNLYNIALPKESDEAKRKLLEQNKDVPFMRDIFSRDISIITHKSVALAAQTFMLSIKAEGYDSCPMEGLDSVMLKKYLNLPDAAEITMAIGVGKGTEHGIYGSRFRIPFNDVVFER